MKLPGTIGSLIPWWALGIVGLVILAFVISLSGCATGDYWVKVRDPLLIRGIHEVERPCGRSYSDGCSIYGAGIIEIRRGMSPALRDCVLKHERKHFEGYEHDPRGGFAADCGDGTMVTFTN